MYKMDLNSKRGSISITMIVGLILGVIGLVIAIFAVTGLMYEVREGAPEFNCRSSVLARGKFVAQLDTTLIGDNPLASPVQLNCKKQDREIKGSKEEVMEEIAEHLADCWYMCDEGRIRCVLENARFFDGCDPGCFKCYNLIVQESSSFKDGDAISMGEFNYYLANHKYKKLGISYGEYLKVLYANNFVDKNRKMITPDSVYSVSFWQGFGEGIDAKVILGDVDDEITLQYTETDTVKDLLNYGNPFYTLDEGVLTFEDYPLSSCSKET